LLSLATPAEYASIVFVTHSISALVVTGQPPSWLVKSSSLTRAEKRELQKHPKRSYDILSEIRFPYPDVALLARHHHEWVDGSGYPDAKRDSQIPIGARIIAVADAFDAMMSNRPYRKSLPLTRAIAEIRDYVHQHFDPEVARVFFRILPRLPRPKLEAKGGQFLGGSV